MNGPKMRIATKAIAAPGGASQASGLPSFLGGWLRGTDREVGVTGKRIRMILVAAVAMAILMGAVPAQAAFFISRWGYYNSIVGAPEVDCQLTYTGQVQTPHTYATVIVRPVTVNPSKDPRYVNQPQGVYTRHTLQYWGGNGWITYGQTTPTWTWSQANWTIAAAGTFWRVPEGYSWRVVTDFTWTNVGAWNGAYYNPGSVQLGAMTVAYDQSEIHAYVNDQHLQGEASYQGSVPYASTSGVSGPYCYIPKPPAPWG